MKAFVQSFSAKPKNAFKKNDAQGATEYILLLVVIVGVAMLFGDKFKTAVTEKLDSVTRDIGSFGSNRN